MTFNIALFGDQNPSGCAIHFKEWSQAILDLCKKENIVPDYLSLKLLNGKSSNLKLSTFINKLAKLENKEINYLDISKSESDFSYISIDWELSTSIVRKKHFDRIYFGFNSEKLKSTYLEKFNIILNLLRFIEVDYGFCFHMDLKSGPGLYAADMIATSAENILTKFDKESMALWSNYQPKAFQAVKTGKLKYLYEFNIINNFHLKRHVFGKRLEDWITSSSVNGSLHPLKDNLFLWSIETAQLDWLFELLMDQNIFLLDRNLKPNFE
ncbi:hypothetical protein [Leptospira sp. 85282-16]|uniref:hypothetical protein n=1 Tax=Leptospira sp. 85282-16 TaxID=2971256 RepID=UPI0021BE2B2C|nr:hypothetical protein [Leptospira sp. 85282-16]